MDLLVFALILAGLVVLVMFLQFINAKRDDRLYLKQLHDRFGLTDRSSYDYDRISFAKAYHIRHLSEEAIDDITWSDLSMDDVFACIDKTESDAGAQMLYHLLRTPLFDGAAISKRRSIIDFFCREAGIRDNILLYLHHAKRRMKESLYDLVDKLKELEKPSFTKYIVRVLLLVASIALMAVSPGIGAALFVIIVLSNLYVYYRDRNSLIMYLSVYDHVLELLSSAEEIAGCFKPGGADELSDIESEIQNVISSLKVIKKGSVVLHSSKDPLAVLFAILGIFTYSDIIGFWILKDRLLENEKEIDELIRLCGSIDAYISMAGYVTSWGQTRAVPEFTEGNRILAEDVYHPLIQNAVTNTLDMDKSMLLTGANASGKSTFLRSAALSMLFSQTLGYANASRYEAPLIRFISAMSVKDNVINAESYYMAEIKAVKRIIDSFENETKPVMHVCFIDELLNGTNTQERIAACTIILKSLAEKGIFVLAATHDIELTYLLKDHYSNHHFEEDLSDGDVKFSYKLMDGPATTRNAIRLLKQIGFDEDLVLRAEEMVKRQEETGVWS